MSASFIFVALMCRERLRVLLFNSYELDDFYRSSLASIGISEHFSYMLLALCNCDADMICYIVSFVFV